MMSDSVAEGGVRKRSPRRMGGVGESSNRSFSGVLDGNAGRRCPGQGRRAAVYGLHRNIVQAESPELDVVNLFVCCTRGAVTMTSISE